MSKGLFIIGIFSSWLLFFSSCKKEATGIDQELYTMASSSSGFTWFKLTGVSLPKSSGSGHNYPFLRTRYNPIASTSLDSIGMVLPNSKFKEGSFIVKELQNSSGSLERYAILYKDSGNEYADAEGWVWGYINSDGTVAETAEKKGTSCIGCHQQSGNIDYGLMNKFFP